jgi:hypothetical protein
MWHLGWRIQSACPSYTQQAHQGSQKIGRDSLACCSNKKSNQKKDKKNSNKNILALDNTLRYLYITLRNRGLKLMAIEFKHKGRIWRADTVEEAIKLRSALEEDEKLTLLAQELDGKEPDYFESIWTSDLIMELFSGIGDLQKKFIRVLGEHKEISSGEIINSLSLKSEVSLAGILSGLSKQMKKMQMNPYHLYRIRIEWSGKTKTRFFQLSGNFKFEAQVLGWPEADIDK